MSERNERPAYTAADVDRLTEHASDLLDQLRAVLAEIGHRMTVLTTKAPEESR